MKILYFHQHFSTPKGATGIRSYVMARKLIEQGHEVTIVCGSNQSGNTGLSSDFSKGCRQGIVDNIQIIEYDLAYSNSDGFFKRTWLFLQFALRSIFVVFTQKYDLIFATTTPLTAGIPGIFARWLRGKPFIFEVRDLWPELPKKMGVIKNPIILGLMSWLEWCSYHSAHHLIALSPGIVEGIMKRGIKKESITMIPNGCDLSIFSNATIHWRPKEVANSDFMAIFAGAHGIANGLDSVISAAFELKKRQHHDIKIVLIGEGKLKASLMEKAQRLELENIIFHPPVDKQKLAGLFASADLGLQILANIPAFYYGTSPNKFFDYIAAGLPVLNNYPGWLAKMIKEYQCGFSIPPDNAIAFADALEEAANNSKQLKLMGKNAQLLAKEKFDRKNLSTQFVNCLEKQLMNK